MVVLMAETKADLKVASLAGMMVAMKVERMVVMMVA